MDTSVNLIFNTLGEGKLKRFTQEVNKLNKTVITTNDNLDGANVTITKTGKFAKYSTTGIQAFGASMLKLLGPIVGITTALGAFSKAVNTAFERDAAENRLKNLAKTTGDYEYALAAAREASQKFGFTLTESTKLFGDAQARIGTLGYNVEQVNEVFTGFNTIAREAGVNSQDAAGAFTQLAQGMAAGTLQGDELRSILERMPALAKVLADEMEVPVEQIKKLGSEGKITSDIIYRALSNAAEGAGDLNGKLTPLQKAFNSLKGTIENAFNAIGETIEPILVPAIQAAVVVVQKFTDIWNYVANSLFPKVAESFAPVFDRIKALFKDFNWELLGNLITNALVKPIEIALKSYEAMIPAINFLIGTFEQLSNNPIVKSLVGAVGSLLDKLGLLKAPVTDFKNEVEASQKSTSELAAGVSAAKEDASALAESATKLAQAQKSAADEAIRAANAGTLQMQMQNKLLEAEFGLQKTLLDIEMKKAQMALEKAKTNEEVIKASNRIFEITIEQAKLDKAIAEQRINSAVAELKQKSAVIKLTLKQAEAEKAVLVAKGEATDKADAAIDKIKQQLQETDKLVANQEAIAEIQKAQSDAIFEQTVNLAEQTKQQNILEGKERLRKDLNKGVTGEMQAQTGELAKQSTAIAQQNAQIKKQIALKSSQFKQGRTTTETVKGVGRSDLPKEITDKIIGTRTNLAYGQAARVQNNRLREDSRKAAGALKMFTEQMNNTDKSYQSIMGDVKKSYGDASGYIVQASREMYNSTKKAATGIDNAVSAMYTDVGRARAQAKAAATQNTSQPKTGSFASGGYINTPTRAMVGEGGEGEYIVPESKMYEAMQRFGRGQRGESVVPSSASVNVNWSGETVQMDGKNYIEKSQMPGLIQTAVNETMNTLHRNARARAFAGI